MTGIRTMQGRFGATFRLATPVLLSLLATACEKNEGVFPANQPPRTYLSVIGAELDTTDYRKILHWWGTDVDGEVREYLIRWDGSWRPDSAGARLYNGQTYAATTATSDTFSVPLDGTFARRTFTVRAIDDQGLVDPVGVTQAFPLSNRAPSLLWNPSIPRPATSLPAVAFAWNPTDFDGRSTVSRFRVWLDGDSANAKATADTVFALRPEDFGGDLDRNRTVFVQAFDDANASSNVLSHTWLVESPRGEWLLIDQITGAGTSTWDRPFFQAVLDSTVGASLHTIDLVTGPDFVTPVEIEPLFSLFRGVVWVTGPYSEANDAKMARNLGRAEMGIEAYVRAGGRVFLAGQSVFGTNGGLSLQTARDLLGIPGLYQIPIPPENDLVSDTPLLQGEPVSQEGAGIADTLRAYSTSLKVDFFQTPAAPGSSRLSVAPGSLDRMSGTRAVPDQTQVPAYLGASGSHGEGRITIVTTSWARLFPRWIDGDSTWAASLGPAVQMLEETLIR